MITNAAVLVQKNKIKIKKLILPDLKKGQVLIKIKYSSICHTQIQEISGLRGKDRYLPHCLGHEASGIVINKHQSVKKVNKKDFVCLTWVFSKGISAGGSIYYDKKNDYLRCKWHDWKFCKNTGKCLSYPIKLNPYDFEVRPNNLKNYSVKLKNDEIYLNYEK